MAAVTAENPSAANTPRKNKKNNDDKDPYEEILEQLQQYEEGLTPHDMTDYEM